MIYYGLLLFFFLEYVRPVAYFPPLGILRLNALVPLGVIFGTLVSREGVSNREILAETNTRIILILMSLLALNVLIVEVQLYAYNIFETTMGYALVYWVLARQITDLNRIRGVFKTLVLVHVVVAALTPQMFTDPDVRHVVASGSFLGDGNDFALSVNIIIPFCLFLFFEARKAYAKFFYGGLLLAFVLCVVATKSRGGTIALGCVGLYYWLKSDKKVLTATIAAAAVAIVLVNAPPAYFERMNTISTSPQDGSAQGRLIAWGAAVRMAVDNPVFGVGAGHFPVMFGTTYRPKGVDSIPWLTAHSIYFLILGELGLPGITLLLTFIISNIMANRRLTKKLVDRNPAQARTEARLLASLSASVLAYAVGGAFLSAVYYPHIFVLCGLAFAARRIVREGAPAEQTAEAAPVRPLTYHPALRGVITLPGAPLQKRTIR